MNDDDHSFEHDFDARVAERVPGGDVEAILRQVHEIIATARPAPLSTQVKIDRDEVLDLLDQAIERLPDEVRASRWLLKDREEFLARTQREADDILAAARGQAERMVQRSEVMKAAEAKARRIIENARAEASRQRNEADDFCDKRLAQLETILEKTLSVIASGRAKLRGPAGEGLPPAGAAGGSPPLRAVNGHDDERDRSAPVFFDQDKA
ncbi:MAG TPA: ATP synthase F0 subunit B [Acidimicrobiales bacterium]|jgi:F0F1-type ATP synthase membrane subunit b/b'|nr:ATP synthase F0 subunit B [Acidimicrobiales bacterium]